MATLSRPARQSAADCSKRQRCRAGATEPRLKVSRIIAAHSPADARPATGPIDHANWNLDAQLGSRLHVAIERSWLPPTHITKECRATATRSPRPCKRVGPERSQAASGPKYPWRGGPGGRDYLAPGSGL